MVAVRPGHGAYRGAVFAGGTAAYGPVVPARSALRRGAQELLEPGRVRGLADPQPMQRLLREAMWHADAVRDGVRDLVAEHLGRPGAVPVVDKTGFLEKGEHSVAVRRQYTGTAGRIENAQVAVFLAYAAPAGRALIDRRVYLPASWRRNRERAAAAGVPERVGFAAKPRLALQMIDPQRPHGLRVLDVHDVHAARCYRSQAEGHYGNRAFRQG